MILRIGRLSKGSHGRIIIDTYQGNEEDGFIEVGSCEKIAMRELVRKVTRVAKKLRQIIEDMGYPNVINQEIQDIGHVINDNQLLTIYFKQKLELLSRVWITIYFIIDKEYI